MASRIAIVEDSANGRMLLGSLLAAGHYDVTCHPSDEVDQIAFDQQPALIVFGPSVADIDARIEGAKAAPSLRSIPVFVLARDAAPAARLALIMAGARDVADYPASGTSLLARIRVLLREADIYREVQRRHLASLKFGFAEAAPEFAVRKRILCLQDANARKPALDLGSSGGWVVSHASPADALAPRDEKSFPDGYILDWRGVSALSPVRQALPELRARSHSRHAIVLVIHSANDTEAAVQALDAGASDVVSDDVLPGEITCRISRLLKRKVAEDALRQSSEDGFQLAVTDPLTGLYNRRYAEAYMADLLADQSEGRPFAFMMADIDHFKSINDTHGHDAGDDVLRDVAQRLRSEMRAIDLVARYGGEEFLIVLAETDLLGAELAANRLRQRIGNAPVILSNGIRVSVTMSIGVCLGNAPMVRQLKSANAAALQQVWQNPMSELLKRADTALYKAKAKGRNCIQMAVNSA